MWDDDLCCRSFEIFIMGLYACTHQLCWVAVGFFPMINQLHKLCFFWRCQAPSKWIALARIDQSVGSQGFRCGKGSAIIIVFVVIVGDSEPFDCLNFFIEVPVNMYGWGGERESQVVMIRERACIRTYDAATQALPCFTDVWLFNILLESCATSPISTILFIVFASCSP